jgi:hypothetical protein
LKQLKINMIKEELNILSIQFQNEEINVWKSLLKKLYIKTTKIGFKKEFNTNEIELIRELVGEEPNDNVDLSNVNYKEENDE